MHLTSFILNFQITMDSINSMSINYTIEYADISFAYADISFALILLNFITDAT